MKQCNRCKQSLPDEDFHRNRANKDGLNRRCKACTVAYNRERYPEVRERRIAYQKTWDEKNKFKSRLRKYGLTLEQYNAIKEQQSGKCAICKESPTKYFYVDHCHDTGRVRGLLCLGCNTGLGNFKDSPEVLKEAIAYLTSQLQTAMM